jgi:NADPH:quinone reductase-like Zn-dependent oxidoreductase
LIHGAAGGVGSFAVQMAHWRGAYVIGTASSANLAFVRELGADEALDYTAACFEDVVHGIDLVLDTVGGDTLERSWSIVRRGGTIVTVVGDISKANAAEYGVRGTFFIVKPSGQQLRTIGKLIDGGQVSPVVSAVFPLADARQAFGQGADGHNRGKIVLAVHPTST